jgi:hypothetical protein
MSHSVGQYERQTSIVQRWRALGRSEGWRRERPIYRSLIVGMLSAACRYEASAAPVPVYNSWTTRPRCEFDPLGYGYAAQGVAGMSVSGETVVVALEASHGA